VKIKLVICGTYCLCGADCGSGADDVSFHTRASSQKFNLWSSLPFVWK